MGAVMVKQDVAWKVVHRKYSDVAGDFGSIVLKNVSTGERREVRVVDLRSAGYPGFKLQTRYAQSEIDGVFYGVR